MKLKVLAGVCFGLAIILTGVLVIAGVYVDKHKVVAKPSEHAFDVEQDVKVDEPAKDTDEDKVNKDIPETSNHKIDYKEDLRYDAKYFSAGFLEDVGFQASSEDSEIVLALAQRYCELLNNDSRQLRLVSTATQGSVSIYTIDSMGQVLRVYVIHDDELTAYITEV